MPAAIRFSGITKQFPGVVALDDVSFEIAAGTCHAICGENGAGKSTLGKILTGLQRADTGEISLDDRTVQFGSPRDALAAGVAMVHQELAFCENLTVAENLCLPRLPRRFTLIDRRALRDRAAALLADVQSTIDPGRSMDTLSVAEQQVVQIAGAVAAGARVIVFDEPTSSLGETEAEVLFTLIAQLTSRGVTILYVSHRMAEIFRLSTGVTVLRDGRHVVTKPTADVDEAGLVEAMVGRALAASSQPHDAPIGPERLRVESLSSPGRFADVSFAVRGGEVLGLAGLVGAGRSEVAHALFGLDPAATGTISVQGRRVVIDSPWTAMALGIGFVPEDRKRQGLVLSMRARENITLPTLSRYATLTWVQRARETDVANGWFERLRVRTSAETTTVSLSGGNQQKMVLAKWLAADTNILILDEPTRGVDVAAKAELHAWIQRLASQGIAIVLISSELPELLAVSSRILVLRGGRAVGELSHERASQDALLRLMTGLAVQ